MKFLRFIGYFSQLRAFVGLKSASVFVLTYVGNKINPPQGRTLARVLVGPYEFYFSSLPHFEGLFTEIFFNRTYYLAPTREPIRVIDCGANIGVALLYIKVRAPNAHVLCFEPNPAARTVLMKNIAVNEWEKEVQVLPYALGKKRGFVNFFVENSVATSSGGSVANHLGKKGRILDSYMVEVDALSHHIDGDIDLLKMDVEGGEFDIVEELMAHDTLLHRIATIQLEYHYIPGFFTRPLSEMLVLLESSGFRTFVRANAPAHQVINHDVTHSYMVFAWRE